MIFTIKIPFDVSQKGQPTIFRLLNCQPTVEVDVDADTPEQAVELFQDALRRAMRANGLEPG